jgi:hypothetical protein
MICPRGCLRERRSLIAPVACRSGQCCRIFLNFRDFTGVDQRENFAHPEDFALGEENAPVRRVFLTSRILFTWRAEFTG